MARLVPAGSADAAPFAAAPHGWQVMVEGQIHNHRALAARFGDGSPAALYGAALAHWGDAVDQHVIGHYCAIAVAPDGQRMRLARSPFSAPPMHYRCDDGTMTASPLLRAVNWALDDRPRPDLVMLARRMMVDFATDGRDWYEGGHRLRMGSAVEVTSGGGREVWRYEIFACPQHPDIKPEQAVEQARSLLDEAVGHALTGARQPGALISGGLDSSQVSASAALQLSPGTVLHGFTYGPETFPADSLVPGQFADDREGVAGMAALYHNLRLHRFANPGQDFRHGQHDLVRAMGCGAPSLGLTWTCHDIYEQARKLGCDVMLSGDLGNDGFSNPAPWGFPEYLRRGRWRELVLALKSNRGDDRPLWRRFVSLALIPAIPAGLGERFRVWLRGQRDPITAHGINPALAAEHRLVKTALEAGYDPSLPPTNSREEFWRRFMLEDGQDTAEANQGFELLYGIPTRDPTAYRPLMELCFSLPTEMFLRHGWDRWLAREMARGRLPEDQRMRRDQGAHDLDWHPRIARARESLLDEVSRMEDDPDIAAVVDLPLLRMLLEQFPERSSWRPEIRGPYINAVNRGITAGRFIAFAKGRNDI